MNNLPLIFSTLKRLKMTASFVVPEVAGSNPVFHPQQAPGKHSGGFFFSGHADAYSDTLACRSAPPFYR
ncbi:hypothetical protein [Robiginitalea biformata]|uniref:Uncharacterized protein n=1 Tax=Robiginitalea biformata (strain ATCC BAA-864 / DSM 15991 / KCTC 12146 / HTCC2501) TaxID=313596 RepID=A4CKK7_ROBBH|nr:hypothetical protein [Robiginitalea biformata]EAR15406.1 hypothetical protein RB2501_13799 [Robiginitalea biformata HTCC2501]